jgi:hypothetical protein
MFSPTGRPASRVSPIAAMGDKFYKTRSETDQSGKRAVAKKIMISNGCPFWILIEPCAFFLSLNFFRFW